jgi:ribonuclease J
MSKLRIIPLGGIGSVTKNMFAYEYEDEILLVDCGIGFPELNMHGVDLLIPDVSYLIEQVEAGKKIVGLFFSHGHDDHIAAAGYILPQLPEFPLFASPLTAAFAETRMRDHQLDRPVTILREREPVTLGYFTVESIAMTHSVPDTRHLIIRTPEGIIYHGSDFKLDTNPVDGVLPDYQAITDLSKEGILCMLIDCLRIENTTMTQSESTVKAAIEREMAHVKGKVIVTLMSSHIHRIQQVVDAAIAVGRKVVFIGRSVEQNVESAMNLKKLRLHPKDIVDKRQTDSYPDSKLCLVIAGSQGQEGSSLVRAVFGEHQMVQISKQDKVIFSADVIPGNEQAFYGAIDELAKNGIDVVYPDIKPDLHVSGHASAVEQQQIIELAKPKYVFPIGGAYRHQKLFADLAESIGYSLDHVVLPKDGQVVEFENGQKSWGETLLLKELMVDGKGIGDVGTMVLSDRKIMSQDGMLVLVIPRVKGKFRLKEVQVVSRGFIYMRDSEEFVQEIKLVVAEMMSEMVKAGEKPADIKRRLERRLTRRLDKVIGRTPLIMTVFVDLD